MIDAKEYRIGNWILCFNPNEEGYPHNLTTQITLQHFKLMRDEGNFKDYSPIPLTTKILEKCGFKYFKDFDPLAAKYVSNYYLNTDKIQISFIYGMTILNDNSKNSAEAQIILDYKIEYLHQLQNLIFAFTNKELEIKL